MRMRPLGSGGPLVSELALGTMVFGEEGDRGTSTEESIRMIGRYLDAGGNHIDTANVYAGGRSEEIVGKAIKGHRGEVVLATKCGFAPEMTRTTRVCPRSRSVEPLMPV